MQVCLSEHTEGDVLRQTNGVLYTASAVFVSLSSLSMANDDPSIERQYLTFAHVFVGEVAVVLDVIPLDF